MTLENRMLRRIGINTFSVLGGDVLNKAGIFLVYAILSRQAGVHEFGQLSLGLLLLYTFHVFAVAGLPIALTREVAKRPKAAKRLLRHGYLAALLPASLSVVGMIVLAIAMRYEQQTVLVIALLALAIPAYALTMITEAVIKGREQMHLIAIGNVPGNIFLVVCSFAALALGYGVTAVACVVVASRVITFVMMHALFHINARDCRAGGLRPRLSWLLLRNSMVFFGTDGIEAISASIFALMLSKFATEREVGLLSASFQLLQPIQMFFRSVGHSLFPPLVAAAKVSATAVGNLTRSTLGFIMRLAFPAALVVFCLAGDVLATVYGNEAFRESAIVLQILAFTLIMMPMNPILGHGLWAMDHEKFVFKIVVINLVCRTVIGFACISQYGLIGAASSSLICCFINTAQHYWYFDRHVSRLHFGQELVKIVPAALTAVICVAMLPIHHIASLAIALLLYTLLAFNPMERLSLLIGAGDPGDGPVHE